ncbi:hypothetical protein ACFFMN_03445 [Planobispora siamensis]|uniref:Uncharacterized protein n=1 Tax=Planobispora siamensis TaxID=936338 RepID=A0A8J3SLV4_9ACTN|nr:hypothetical protein [Planobispora siamensis]GIH94734.1 hypothetical protein Psi01_53640 [Planobispora siamensis]
MKHAAVRRPGRPALVAALAGGMVLTGGVPAAHAEPVASAAPAKVEAKLGPFGYRGVEPGMSAREARATRKIVRTGGWRNCTEWDFKTGPHHRTGPDVLISRRYGVAAVFAGEGVETPRGIGIGSTRRQLERAYPNLSTAGSGYPVATVRKNPKVFYFFLLDGGRIYQMGLVLKRQDCAN